MSELVKGNYYKLITSAPIQVFLFRPHYFHYHTEKKQKTMFLQGNKQEEFTPRLISNLKFESLE